MIKIAFFDIDGTLLQNHLSRTLFCTFAAISTLVIVNHSQIVVHMDGI